jgi:predicted transcriptional regulator
MDVVSGSAVVSDVELDGSDDISVFGVACILVLAFAAVRFLDWLLVGTAKRVVTKLLEDEELHERSSAAFHEMMISLQDDELFRDELATVVAGDVACKRLKKMFADMMTDERFLNSAEANTSRLISHLVKDEMLKDAVKEQISAALADTDLHRATIQGALDAIPDSVMKSLVAKYVAPREEPASPAQPPLRPSAANLPGVTHLEPPPPSSGFQEFISEIRNRLPGNAPFAAAPRPDSGGETRERFNTVPA